MVRLKKRYAEGKQLSFFDYYNAHKDDIKEEPKKNDVLPIDNAKESEDSMFDADGNYKGLSDDDYTQWEHNDEFLRDKYKEYNRRFFGGRLPSEFSIYWGKLDKSSEGVTKQRGNIITDEIIPYAIVIATNNRFTSRYYLEGTIIHEMCHVYQANILCEGMFSKYKEDTKKGKGSYGHGPLFFQAANLVNNSPDNKEGFKITQYASFGESLSIGKKFKKADGYFALSVQPNYVTFKVIPESKKQRISNISDNLFTYRDAEAKSYICNNIKAHGDLSLYLSPTGSMRIISKIKQMIKDGELLPIKPVIDEKDNKLYHVCITSRWSPSCNNECLIVSTDDTWKIHFKGSLDSGFSIQYREIHMSEEYKNCITLCKDGYNPLTNGFEKAMKFLSPCVISMGEWKTITNESLTTSESHIITEDSEGTDMEEVENMLLNTPNVISVDIIKDGVVDIEVE